MHLGYHIKQTLEKSEGAIKNGQSKRIWQHCAHKTQEEEKTNKPQHRRLNSNTDPTKNRCASKELVKCKQLLTPMRHLPCHLHSQNVLDTIIMIPIRHTCYQSSSTRSTIVLYLCVPENWEHHEERYFFIVYRIRG
jgi:hypothetical protein